MPERFEPPLPDAHTERKLSEEDLDKQEREQKVALQFLSRIFELASRLRPEQEAHIRTHVMNDIGREWSYEMDDDFYFVDAKRTTDGNIKMIFYSYGAETSITIELPQHLRITEEHCFEKDSILSPS